MYNTTSKSLRKRFVLSRSGILLGKKQNTKPLKNIEMRKSTTEMYYEDVKKLHKTFFVALQICSLPFPLLFFLHFVTSVLKVAI